MDVSKVEERDSVIFSAQSPNTLRSSYSMSETLDQLIARIDAAVKQAQESGDTREYLVVTGEILMNGIQAEHSSAQEQEKAIIKLVNLITQAVNGFSDYAECFWSASYFLQLIIEKYSAKAVLQTVKACAVLFGTENSSDDFQEGWSLAAVKRCAQMVKVESAEQLSEPAVLKSFKDVNAILREVCDAGNEYKELIKENADLKDALAEVNLLLEQSSGGARGTVFDAANKAAVDAVKKELFTLEAMSSDSSEAIIIALEQSVDLSKPTGTPLFEAYNAMCEEQEADLALQVRAAQGPLAQLAIQAIVQQNEEKEGKKHLFLEALVFSKLLLEPWDRDDEAHMAVKEQIATYLKDQGIVPALLGQLAFWANEWKFSFGDCGDPAVIALLHLARYFPSIVAEEIQPNAGAVAFIRHNAEYHRANAGRSAFGAHRESAYSASVVLEAFLDGQPEPPMPTKQELAAGFGGFGGFGGGGVGLGGFGGFGAAPPAANNNGGSSGFNF